MQKVHVAGVAHVVGEIGETAGTAQLPEPRILLRCVTAISLWEEIDIATESIGHNLQIQLITHLTNPAAN